MDPNPLSIIRNWLNFGGGQISPEKSEVPDDPWVTTYKGPYDGYIRDDDDLDILFSDTVNVDDEWSENIPRRQIPFSEGEGLVERVKYAITPLTNKENFSLDSIRYDISLGSVDIRLQSHDMDLHFSRQQSFLNDHEITYNQCHCFFRIIPLKRSFDASYLLPVLKVDMPVIREKIRLDLKEKKVPQDLSYKHMNFLFLVEKTYFIEELNQCCIRLEKNLPRIRTAFNPENIDETIRLYIFEKRGAWNFDRLW
jgi:hypothetical protein